MGASMHNLLVVLPPVYIHKPKQDYCCDLTEKQTRIISCYKQCH